MNHKATIIEYYADPRYRRCYPSNIPYKLIVSCPCGLERFIYGNERMKAVRIRDSHNRKTGGLMISENTEKDASTANKTINRITYVRKKKTNRG
jgi:hypothetical protein